MDKLAKYQGEIFNLQLKYHGQIATIIHNEMNEKFDEELEKANIDYDEFETCYEKLSEFYSQNYFENKESSDNAFIQGVISDIKRMIEIANMIEGE